MAQRGAVPATAPSLSRADEQLLDGLAFTRAAVRAYDLYSLTPAPHVIAHGLDGLLGAAAAAPPGAARPPVPDAAEWAAICRTLLDRVEAALPADARASEQYRAFAGLLGRDGAAAAPEPVLGKLLTLYAAPCAQRAWHDWWPRAGDSDVLDRALNAKVQAHLARYPALDAQLLRHCSAALRQLRVAPA